MTDEIIATSIIVAVVMVIIANLFLYLKLNMIVHTLEIIALLYAICVSITDNNQGYILFILVYNFCRRLQILFRDCVSHYHTNKEDNKKA